MTAVLVVDDEIAIRESVGYALRNEGFDVDEAADGAEALASASAREYDVILLDLILPRVSGLDVCREVRRESPVPIIMVTARGAEMDRVVGLELGADDYVIKPFSIAELVSRVRAVIRRRQLDSESRPRLQIGGITINHGRHEIVVDGERRDLTVSEYRLLSLLASAPDRVFTREELMDALWGRSLAGSRACDNHITNLRRKIERDPARPQRLLTVRGVGYKLAAV
jgi:two-component system, OmpR family, response regulator RegX3